MTWTAITAFRLVTQMPERLVAFYAALGFAPVAPEPIAAAEMALLGVGGRGSRWTLRLGSQRIELDSFEAAGRPDPADATAADQAFQHFALVTGDAAGDWVEARAAGATPISRDGPVMLPASSGGVTAIKFRDPEGHPLELLQFPNGSDAAGIIRIDHSAISVADAEASIRFYKARGLRTGDETLNHGEPQDRLDGLADVAVRVVPLKPAQCPPHLELLGYRAPRPGPHAPFAANDIVATRLVWAAGEDALVRDPDGHLHQLSR